MTTLSASLNRFGVTNVITGVPISDTLCLSVQQDFIMQNRRNKDYLVANNIEDYKTRGEAHVDARDKRVTRIACVIARAYHREWPRAGVM